MNNKKGQFQLIGLGIIVLLAIIILGLFLFSSELRWIIGGVALVGLSIFALLKYSDNKKLKTMIIATMFVGGLLLVFVLPSTSQSIFGTEDVIYTVDSGRLECLEDSVEVELIKWVDQDYSFTCGDNELVDDCRIVLECGDTTFLSPKCDGAYKINDGSWVTYSLNKMETKTITTISPGQKIDFAQKIFTNSGGIGIPANEDITIIHYTYNPYKLWTIEKGAKVTTNSNDCSLANQNTLTKKNIQYGEWDTLDKGEVRNYFLNWERAYGLKIYDYENKEVLCSLNTLYELDSEKLADGTTRNIQGEAISYVECCPHQDNNCGDDFKFLPVEEEKEVECTYSYQCDNSGNPIILTENKAQKEVCIDNMCEIETFNIECGSTAYCIEKFGEDYVCSKASSTFGQCIESKISQTYCGDGICQVGETFSNCPADCDEEDKELSCAWYQEEKVVNEVSRTWYNYIGIGDAEVITSNQCKTASWVYLVSGLSLVLILGSLYILTNNKKPVRRKR